MAKVKDFAAIATVLLWSETCLNHKGTGLGLAISRSIVESRGARIWATPNSGPGATFYFTLPSRVAVAA